MCLDTETDQLRPWEEGELEQYLAEQDALIEEQASKMEPFHITPGMTYEEALKGCGGVTLEEFWQIGLRKIKELYGGED